MTPTAFATIQDAVTRCQQGPVGLCATLSVQGDESLWVQYVDGQANMATRATDWPDGLVASLGGGAIVAFEPRQYLTVDLPVTDDAGAPAGSGCALCLAPQTINMVAAQLAALHALVQHGMQAQGLLPTTSTNNPK
jgi:hypothetical protein